MNAETVAAALRAHPSMLTPYTRPDGSTGHWVDAPLDEVAAILGTAPDHVDPHAASRSPNDPFIVHAVMYRDYKIGTLCNSLAWGAPDRWTTVTDQVTCPACRSKIDGAP